MGAHSTITITEDVARRIYRENFYGNDRHASERDIKHIEEVLDHCLDESLYNVRIVSGETMAAELARSPSAAAFGNYDKNGSMVEPAVKLAIESGYTPPSLAVATCKDKVEIYFGQFDQQLIDVLTTLLNAAKIDFSTRRNHFSQVGFVVYIAKHNERAVREIVEKHKRETDLLHDRLFKGVEMRLEQSVRG